MKESGEGNAHMENLDLVKTIKEVEDYLVPFLELDASERSLHYYLLRYTRLIEKQETLFVIGKAQETVRISEGTARKYLRIMHQKGCIRIEETTRGGLRIKVLLPNEVEGCVVEHQLGDAAIDIEAIDFYRDQKYRATILRREKEKCFYCLMGITSETYVLDHLTPMVNGGDNSYRNIVAACHECNSRKGGSSANDFIRSLYRRGLLNQGELEERLSAIEAINKGQLKPEV